MLAKKHTLIKKGEQPAAINKNNHLIYEKKFLLCRWKYKTITKNT